MITSLSSAVKRSSQSCLNVASLLVTPVLRLHACGVNDVRSMTYADLFNSGSPLIRIMTALFCNYCVTPPSSPISRVQPYKVSLFPMATQTVNPSTVDGYRDSDDEFSSDDQEFHVDERSGRSWPTKILHNVIQPIKPKLVEIGKVSSADPTRCKPSRGARKRCDVQENKVENIWTYDMTPKSSDGEKRSYARRILYFAGGGWQAPPSGK